MNNKSFVSVSNSSTSDEDVEYINSLCSELVVSKVSNRRKEVRMGKPFRDSSYSYTLNYAEIEIHGVFIKYDKELKHATMYFKNSGLTSGVFVTSIRCHGNGLHRASFMKERIINHFCPRVTYSKKNSGIKVLDEKEVVMIKSVEDVVNMKRKIKYAQLMGRELDIKIKNEVLHKVCEKARKLTRLANFGVQLQRAIKVKKDFGVNSFDKPLFSGSELNLIRAVSSALGSGPDEEKRETKAELVINQIKDRSARSLIGLTYDTMKLHLMKDIGKAIGMNLLLPRRISTGIIDTLIERLSFINEFKKDPGPVWFYWYFTKHKEGESLEDFQSRFKIPLDIDYAGNGMSSFFKVNYSKKK